MRAIAPEKKYSEDNELEYREDVRRRLDKAYQKTANLTVPFGKILAFTSAQGQVITFGYDETGNFTIQQDANTPFGLASINFVSSVQSDLESSFASLEASLTADFGDLSASFTTIATAFADIETAFAALEVDVAAANDAAAAAASSALAASASETAAGSSATAAATSATSAATQASNAATSASQASTSETNAAGSAATATTQASNAATSATNASNSASAASTSASTASTQATNAANSASAASTSATSAATQASNAATSASAASTSAGAASTSASQASTSESNAAGSASAAATSATNAATSATSAGNSASAASTSASTASTHATNAGTSASNAATSATNAATSASAAGGSASAASTSASSAATQATNASNSASAANTSAVSAQSVANRLLPDRPAIGEDFTTSSAGEPDSRPALSSGTVVAEAGEGDVREFVGQANFRPRGALPIIAGRTYRISIRVRTRVDAGTNPIFRTTNYVMDSSWTSLGAVGSTTHDSNSLAADGWNTYSVDVTAATILASQPTATYLRPRLIGGANSSDVSQGNTWQVAFFSVRDVTSEVAAAGSASAAATSASSAATSATAAGTSATAASGSATSASTSAGTAGTHASNASTSAGAASTSASNASSSASAASASATAAAASASSASSSASTATTQASAASASASAASTSATLAANFYYNRYGSPFADRPAVAEDFSGSLTSAAPGSMSIITDGTVVNVANEGNVRQWTGQSRLITQGWLPVITGHTYRMTVRARVTVDGTSMTARLMLFGVESDGVTLSNGALGLVTSDAAWVAADGWQTWTLTMSAATILSTASTTAYVRARFDPTASVWGTWQVAQVRLEDITDITATNASVATNASAIATETSARAAADTVLSAEMVSLRNAILPSRPAVGADFSGAPSASETTPDATASLSSGTVVNVANEGDVREFTSNVSVIHRGWLPLVAGHTYRFTTRVRVTVDGTDNRLIKAFHVYNASGSYLSSIGAATVDSSFVSADGWRTDSVEITTATIVAAQPTAAYVRGRLQGGRNASNAYSGATWQCAFSLLEDITDIATANANIATNASAIATETSARAAADTSLTASLGTTNANVSTNASAIATLEGAAAVWEVVAAASGGTPARIGVKTGLGGAEAWIDASNVFLGDNTTFEDPYNSFYTEASSKRFRFGGPFPASGDMVMWFGPTSVALNSETKTNGYFAFATDGKVYYGSAELGGSIKLSVSAAIYDVSTPFSGTITVTATGGAGGYTYQWTKMVGEEGVSASLGGTTTATVTVSATLSAGQESVGRVQCIVTDSAGNTAVISQGYQLIETS